MGAAGAQVALQQRLANLLGGVGQRTGRRCVGVEDRAGGGGQPAAHCRAGRRGRMCQCRRSRPPSKARPAFPTSLHTAAPNQLLPTRQPAPGITHLQQALQLLSHRRHQAVGGAAEDLEGEAGDDLRRVVGVRLGPIAHQGSRAASGHRAWSAHHALGCGQHAGRYPSWRQLGHVGAGGCAAAGQAPDRMLLGRRLLGLLPQGAAVVVLHGGAAGGRGGGVPAIKNA